MPAPTSPYFRTRDSDEWVKHSLIIAPTYSRVLMVSLDETPPKTVAIAPLDLNVRTGASAPAREYPVTKYFRTIQEAADASEGGDLIVVTPGNYAGFAIADARPGAGDGRYIHFKALGKPGDVTIDKPPVGGDQRWVILLSATHHIILEGFHIDGSAFAHAVRPKPDPSVPAAPVWPAAAETHPNYGGQRLDWAGITLGTNFENTGKVAHHIVILNNFSHHHCKWGMVTAATNTVLLQGNLFAHSREEHGAYVSDGSDNYCVRRNIFFGNSGCGMQCNLDSQCSLFATANSPQMKHFRKPAEPYEPWAMELIDEATRVFGQYNFPDGYGRNFIIEENVANQNNKHGGGAFNFSGVQESVIQNNLLYDNFAHGLALYNQWEPFDTAMIMAGISSPAQVTGPGALPFFASHSNLVRNNTILMNNEGRAAALNVSGSYATTFRNNIFINDADDSMHIDSFSIWRNDSDFNVIGRAGFSGKNLEGYWSSAAKQKPTPLPEGFKSLAIRLDEMSRSVLGMTREKLASQFVRDNHEPWVIIESNWWRLNPNRPDLHPRADAKLLRETGDKEYLPPLDANGQRRKTADIGAYAAGSE